MSITLATQFQTPNGLVVHDPMDTLASFEDARTLADRWTGASFLPADGLGHRGALHDLAVIASIVEFIDGRPVVNKAN